jgi:hypothetical protein
MSLASDYAALQVIAAGVQASAAADQLTANTARPPSFTGPNGHAEVTANGNLKLVSTSSGPFEIPAAGALAFAQWIFDTFQ